MDGFGTMVSGMSLPNVTSSKTIWFAERYLQSCESVYGGSHYRAAIVCIAGCAFMKLMSQPNGAPSRQTP